MQLNQTAQKSSPPRSECRLKCVRLPHAGQGQISTLDLRATERADINFLLRGECSFFNGAEGGAVKLELHNKLKRMGKMQVRLDLRCRCVKTCLEEP